MLPRAMSVRHAPRPPSRDPTSRSPLNRMPITELILGRCAMTEHSLAEHSHAQHRWPIDEDPSRAWSSIPMKADQFYPLDDIVAISDTRPSAERIVQALKGAGVLDDDVDLVDGAWF